VAAGIAGVAVMRAVVAISPDPSFGSDPFLDPTPPAALGPAGSMVLDALLIVFAALGFIGEGRARRRVSWALVLLAVAPMSIVLWHGLRVGGFDDLWRGFSWSAAMIAAVAAAHLSRDREVRILLASALAAIVVPLAVRGLVQVFIEHPEMVELYERDRDAVLAARGIEPGSSSALVFERRLEQAEATAWFGLANVFGSFMVACLIVLIGWTIATIRGRPRLESGFAGVMAIAALLAAGGVLLAGSKGAFAAALAGLVLLAIAFVPRVRGLARFGGVIAIGVVALVIAGVVVRGVMLPEDFAGDRSILFRWHYWIGAGRMIAEEPLVGVGPAGFQDAFVRHRMATTPEEAASAHNVFIDWIATLGIAGIVWIGLVCVLLWRAGASLHVGEPSPPTPLPGEGGRRNAPAPQPSPKRRGSERALTSWLAVVALAAFAPALLIEQSALDARAVFFRALGIMGFLALAAIAAKALRRCDDRLVWGSVAAGAIALFVHAQIEVTLTQPGAAAWGFILLGVAGAARGDSAPGGRQGRWIGSGVLLAMLPFLVFLLAPALRQARAIEGAADRLRESGIVRLAMLDVAKSDDTETRVRALERLLEFATGASMSLETLALIRDVQPASRDSLQKMLQGVVNELAWRESSDRSGAAEMLLSAHAMLEINARPIRYSMEQSLTRLTPFPTAGFEGVSARVEEMLEVDRSPAAVALAARVEERCWELSQNPVHAARAIKFRRRLVALDPHGLGPRVALADLLMRAGQAEEAKAEYRRALEQSERWHLDELRQLTLDQRARIEAVLIDD
jgi:hypothetical protein